MSQQDRAPHTGRSPSPESTHPCRHHGPGGGDAVEPLRHAVSHWVLEALVAAYGGDTHRLLTDLAELLETSVAYVDRATVEAHLERPLSDCEWAAVAAEFTAMGFDEHIGDAGTLRTDWIEDRLSHAGVPGRTLTATRRSRLSRRSRSQ